MRAIDPISDHALYANSQELTASLAEYILKIDDTVELKVDRLTYTVWIDAVVKRDGERGPLEIIDGGIREIYLHHEEFSEPVRIDETDFKIGNLLLFNRLENAADLYILNRALTSNEWIANV